MRAALLANTGWLDEELPLYKDLVVGLIDEQVGVTQVLPAGEGERLASSFGRLVTWPESPWRVWNRFRLGRLAQRMDPESIDVVHALDGRTWDAALAWSERLGVPALLSAWSIHDVETARRLRHRLDPQQAVLAATTQPIQRLIEQQVPEAVTVAFTPVGVHVASAPETDGDHRAMSLVVTGNGRLDDFCEPLYEGLREVVEKAPDTQVFIDTMGFDQRQLWRHVERSGLLSNVSFVPRRIGHREVLLRADAFVQPQPLGRARGLLLQAMAHGRPIMAQHDPALDFLIDGVTARVVRSLSAIAWGDRLLHWASQPEDRQQLGESARRWVAEHRLASTFVGSVLDLYRRMVGESLPFR
ncbi:MAG: hypothetical protein ACOC1G_00550 [Phycisphaeraceae bacterium]